MDSTHLQQGADHSEGVDDEEGHAVAAPVEEPVLQRQPHGADGNDDGCQVGVQRAIVAFCLQLQPRQGCSVQEFKDLRMRIRHKVYDMTLFEGAKSEAQLQLGTHSNIH